MIKSICILFFCLFSLMPLLGIDSTKKFIALADIQYNGNDGDIIDGIKYYKNVGNAIKEIPADNDKEYAVFIKNGRYYEKLTINKPFVTLIGEDPEKTILTFDDAAGTKKADGSTPGTSGSASVTISASNFSAENITFENGFDYPGNQRKPFSDPAKAASTQAVALKTTAGSNKAYFKNCRFIGYQDTLFLNSGLHYFKKCLIAGHVDFIFGAGQSVFVECDIVSRDRGQSSDNGYITAPSTQISNKYGFVFFNCFLKKESEKMAKHSVSLGRPWHPTVNLSKGGRASDPNAVGSTVYINCFMEDHISKSGWDSMSGKDKNGKEIWFEPDKDARFYEYKSTGPGALQSKSRKILKSFEAKKYTIKDILGDWEPEK